LIRDKNGCFKKLKKYGWQTQLHMYGFQKVGVIMVKILKVLANGFKAKTVLFYEKHSINWTILFYA